MKYFIVGDVHWSQYSSVVRSRGTKFSTRLENLIKTVEWCEREALAKLATTIIYLGDFFDKAELNAEELTALKEVHWSETLQHIFLVGNHELGLNNLQYNSTYALYNVPNSTVIADAYSFYDGDAELCFLPYVLEHNRKTIKEYFTTEPNKRYIFSHNDICGIQMGAWISTMGFDIKDIENNCTMYFNGHLHNGGYVTDKVLNVGNITGQNFSEDAYTYPHCAFLLETVNGEISVFENPYAFNFYKWDDEKKTSRPDLKQNAVLTIRAYENNVEQYKKNIAQSDRIIASRIIIIPKVTEGNAINTETFAVDSLQKFREFVLENIGNTEAILQELEEVTK